MERGMPDVSSEFAEEGTAAHLFAARLLEMNDDAYGWDVVRLGDRRIQVTEDFADAVMRYVTAIREQAAIAQHIGIEIAVPIDHITGEDGATGTADALLVVGDELQVHDLKFGRGVEVTAQDNMQLAMYGLGALQMLAPVFDIKTVRMVIHQPRLFAVSEWVLPVEALEEVGLRLSEAANKAAALLTASRDMVESCLTPDVKACRFCKAKATCPALRNEVEAAFSVEPKNAELETLNQAMNKVELAEIWAKAVRGEVERRLLDGATFADWKLVEGRKGARQWADETEAEAALKALRLKKDEMYSFSLITPPAAEKLLKPKPKQWAKVAALITQNQGKPSVAHVSDKRQALSLTPVADQFEVVA
jgi:hypothetical protein